MLINKQTKKNFIENKKKVWMTGRTYTFLNKKIQGFEIIKTFTLHKYSYKKHWCISSVVEGREWQNNSTVSLVEKNELD